MWVRYRKLNGHPDGVHRVRDVLFDRNVNEGIAEVPDDRARELTSRCQGCGTYNPYEVVVDRPTVTTSLTPPQTVTIGGVLAPSPRVTDSLRRPVGRPKKR